MKRGWWVLVLMATCELGLIVSQPQWARSVFRVIYDWSWTHVAPVLDCLTGIRC